MTAALLLFAQSLAAVPDVPPAPFRAHVEKLLTAAPALFTDEEKAALRAELKKGDVEAAQKRLDARCLFGVHVNPESRVKAARGPRPAALVRDEATLVLVKVHNEGGVSHPLAVRSEQRWLEVKVIDGALSGRALEYPVVRLKAGEGGKREATFAFDVGQGTEDLGYRAEVPVLFRVSGRK